MHASAAMLMRMAYLATPKDRMPEGDRYLERGRLYLRIRLHGGCSRHGMTFKLGLSGQTQSGDWVGYFCRQKTEVEDLMRQSQIPPPNLFSDFDI
jgi:hypothetical protein